MSEIEFSVVMPCLNEEETLGICIDKAIGFFRSRNYSYEVIVADNGSSDASIDIAAAKGAKVVHITRKGYGCALMGGINAARGKFVFMGDADDSYDFANLTDYVEKLREGNDLIMGNRFRGGIEKNAMPPLHRYLGNPVLTFVGKILFNRSIGDFHCGLRAFRRQAILDLRLGCPGMEFASEMVVRASLADLAIAEVPTTLKPDGRSRAPHLRSWRDGWRHLKFLLVMRPGVLFIWPGLFIFLAGLIITAVLSTNPVFIGSVGFDIHTMLYAAGSSVAGLQIFLTGISTARIGNRMSILPERLTRKFFLFDIEWLLLAGFIALSASVYLGFNTFSTWEAAGFETLVPREMMRATIPAIMLFIAGIQMLAMSLAIEAGDIYLQNNK